MGSDNAIFKLRSLGQSIWYDNLSRRVLRNRELSSLIKDGVSGVTTNPAIFKSAIADTNDYDDDISELCSSLGDDPVALTDELMCRDVSEACDLFKPVYESTKGLDGYVSIELPPSLANDTSGSISAGKKIWQKILKPNLLIKVPATPEGIPVIQALLEEGINVNVTLIFSVTVYEQVINAYFSALESRLEKGLSLSNIISVASFFVSRVDSFFEKKADEFISRSIWANDIKDLFLGKVGVANSKAAYDRFTRFFASKRFRRLAEKGARIQRPLWASTGTKNPAYDGLLYVENLAGTNTVNTLPPKTLELLLKREGIKAELSNGLYESLCLIDSLRENGYPFEQALNELEVDGVHLFVKSYEALVSAIREKILASKPLDAINT